MARLSKTLAFVLVAGMLLSGSALAGPGGHHNSGEPDIPNIVFPADHYTAVAPEIEEGDRAPVVRDVIPAESRDAWLKNALLAFLARVHYFVAW